MNIDWDLLIRYVADSCDDSERKRFERWLAEAQEHQVVLQYVRDMVVQAQRQVSVVRSAELLASIRHSISAAESVGSRSAVLRVARGGAQPRVVLPLSTRREPTLSVWLKIAAVLLLLVGGAVVWRGMSRAPSSRAVAFMPPSHDVVAAYGRRVTLPLPDGSAVVLAPGSRLRMAQEYGVRNRIVSLVGEGSFTVTHDASLPFVVHTTHGVAKDLGTRFLVREYEGDSSAEVVVAEGKVELRSQGDTTREAVLVPRQRGRIESSGKIVVYSDVELDPYFAWTEGRLVIRDVPLRDAIVQLARWYDVDIRLTSGAIAEQHITATVQSEPVGDVLRMVARSFGLELEVSSSGRIYTLRAR